MNFLEEIEHCAALLKANKTLLYPTDTIWGLGCKVSSEAAIERIYEIKERPPNKSMIILVDSESMAQKYVVSIPPIVKEYLNHAERPTSFILKASNQCPKGVISESGEVAIRVVKDTFCQQLIKAIGEPITSTSANISGKPSPGSFTEIDKRVLNKVDYVVNWRQDDKESTIPSGIVRFDFESGELIKIR